MSITTKTIGPEHTRKVGFLTGVHLKIALVPQYRDQLKEELELEDDVIELRKEIVYQNNYKSKVLAIYSILSRADNVDQ